MDLSIIIVSYNSKELTLKCLQSLMRSNDRLKREIFIVDNASTDGSIEAITSQYSEVVCVVNKDNLGFGPANNLAAAQATGKYLLFLNSDTEVYPDTLEDLWESAERNNSAIASCKLINPDGSTQPQGGSLPTIMNIAAWMWFIDDLPGVNRVMVPYQQRRLAYFKQDQIPGWVAGTAMLIKKTVFDQMGGFDLSIFLYGEDVELCYRARKQGIRVDYFAKPQVLHLGQGSGSSKHAILGEYQGLKHLYQKHHPHWQFSLVRLLLKTGALLRIVIFGMIRSDAQRKIIYQEAFRLA
jgi:GT2 family glycosyltransferase